MDTMPSIRHVRAPAKLNIRLKVTGCRPDGYHELVSLMVPVCLFDRLELKTNPLHELTLTCRGRLVPATEDNLASRAARVFFSATGIDPGLSIDLYKNIPVAAGLGGGSSDAGCVLKTLNDMWNQPLTAGDLTGLATRLGADVPFFLRPRASVVRGIGEILEPTRKWPLFWYVIITPPFCVSTARVYGRLKLKLTTGEYAFILKTLEKEPLPVAQLLENDLETVTASRFPVIGTIKKSLVNAGAEGALMSGSGPSVFGIFKSKAQALAAKRALEPRELGDIVVVEGLGPKDR
jgi:4-diphosphocytidyl-2-C-methyl-D-erythritol kinase